jgi:hypothetical protein
MSNQNVSSVILILKRYFIKYIFPTQRRFSENPSNRIWESEEPNFSPLNENIELVDVHTDNASIKANSTKKMPIKLPTLSVSGPSRNHSPTSPTEEETGKFL